MSKNGNVSESATRPGQGKTPVLHPLHEAALKLAGLGLTRSQNKTRDLVAMLLGHGARAWRSSQPEVGLHLHVVCPRGGHPVRIRLR